MLCSAMSKSKSKSKIMFLAQLWHRKTSVVLPGCYHRKTSLTHGRQRLQGLVGDFFTATQTDLQEIPREIIDICAAGLPVCYHIRSTLYPQTKYTGRGERIMGTNLDEMVIGLLKSLAFCVIMAGVLAVPVQLLHSPGLHTYLPTTTYS